MATPIIGQSRKGLLSLAPRPGAPFPAGSLGTGTSCSTQHLVPWSVSCLFSSDHSHASDPHSACHGEPGSWGAECVPWTVAIIQGAVGPWLPALSQCLSQTLCYLQSPRAPEQPREGWGSSVPRHPEQGGGGPGRSRRIIPSLRGASL